MGRLIVASLVRNEAGRFWRSALEAWSSFADEIVVLDDGSTDDSAAIARHFTTKVYDRFLNTDPAWGKEASARAELWGLAAEYIASEGDYILVADADMVPAHDPRPLLASEPDAIAFNLYDLWGPDAYRTDGYWQGHNNWRTWCVKRPEVPAGGWVWPNRGIHVGHFPLNLDLRRVVHAPRDFGLLHYAYSTPALREAKHEAYMSIADQLSDFEWAHAASILSAAEVAPLPFEPSYRLKLAHEESLPA